MNVQLYAGLLRGLLRTFSYLVVILSVAGACADGVEEPIPSYYEEAGTSPNRKYVNQHANEVIDPFTGKLQWHFTDLFIPGNGGLDLVVQRSYSSLPEFILGSLPPEPAPAGIGWTMHFGRVMRKAIVSFCALGQSPSANPVLEMGDGSRQILHDALDGMSHMTTQFWRAECALEGAGGLFVYSPDGTRYEMTTAGTQLGSPTHPVNVYYTTRIVDRNGNTMNFSYEFLGPTFGVSSITTSDGRSVNFTYVGNNLTKVTDGTRTWEYVTVNGDLREVKRPDGASWKFEYNTRDTLAAGAGSLKKVTYPTGGTIDYSYDFVRFSDRPYFPRTVVVKQKVADGGTWNYSYKPAIEQLPADPPGGVWSNLTDDQMDVTTINGPEGQRIFKHWGYTTAPGGGVMYIGKEVVNTGQGTGEPGVTSAEWSSHTYEMISWQPNRRLDDTSTADLHTNAVVFWNKAINRNGAWFGVEHQQLGPYGNPGKIVEAGNARRETDVTHAVNTSKWILHQKKDETIRLITPEGAEPVGQILRTIDGNGNVRVENRFGVVTQFSYTDEGDLQTRTDARNNATTYGSYYRGIPRTEQHPEGVNISRTVSAAGNVLTETDGENATTGWLYDDLNRPTRITHPRGNVVDIIWQPNRRLLTRGIYSEETLYDAFGRDSQVVHRDAGTAQALTINNRFDILGRKVFSSYPNNVRGTSYKYDMIGQLQQVGFGVNPDTGLGHGWRTYNLYGDRIEFLNELNFTYVQRYRSYSDPEKLELMSVEAPDAAANVVMKRNGLGQLLEVSQGGKTRTFVYDSKYFLKEQTDPETGLTSYGRDAVGNMTSKKVGDGPQTDFTYDNRNRLKTTAYADGKTSTRTYFNDDKLHTLVNDVAARQYAYDGNKNMTSESLTLGTQTFTIGYAYNANDALESMTYGTGQSIVYNPDGFGRPTQAAPYVTQVAHHPSGSIASMTYANGVQTTMGVNARQWPSTFRIFKTGDYFNREYFYDAVGNIAAVNDLSVNRTMGYDSLDRLIYATGPWAGHFEAEYDGRGNIKRQRWMANGSEYLARNYTYDPASDLLTNVTEVNGAVTTPYDYAYDARGNVTAKGTLTLGYTDASTMRCSMCGTPQEALYEYDGGNMRVRQQKGGNSTYFVYGAAGNLLWEQTPGVGYKQYFYLGGKQIATHEKPLAP